MLQNLGKSDTAVTHPSPPRLCGVSRRGLKPPGVSIALAHVGAFFRYSAWPSHFSMEVQYHSLEQLSLVSRDMTRGTVLPLVDSL